MNAQPEPETLVVAADELQPGVRQALNDVSCGRARLLVERDGVAVAAVVSIHDLDQLRFLALKRKQARDVVQRMRDAFKDVPDGELEREIDKALSEVRAEMAAEREAASPR